jgi:hypothetical protein
LLRSIALEDMPILELSDDGMLHVPGKMLPAAEPHDLFEVERVGNVTLVRPAGPGRPSAREAVAAFERWLALPRPDAPDIPGEHRPVLAGSHG